MVSLHAELRTTQIQERNIKNALTHRINHDVGVSLANHMRACYFVVFVRGYRVEGRVMAS